MELFNVNCFAVFTAAISGFVIGGVWCGPVMGRKWMCAIGLTENDIKRGNMLVIYAALLCLVY